MDSLSWLGNAVERRARLRLPLPEGPHLLARFARPGREDPVSFLSWWRARQVRPGQGTAPRLGWNSMDCAEPESTPKLPLPFRDLELELGLPRAPRAPAHGAVELVPGWIGGIVGPPEPALIEVTMRGPCPVWREPAKVTLARHGAEIDTFHLLECDGSVAAEALDRLSVLARPPLVERPGLPLPPEPNPEAPDGEWVPNIKLVHPRLVWLVAQLSAAFPHRCIYVVSGYRRDAHGSYHRRGRALDLYVVGVPNELVFKLCRNLHDVGCGYYPNSSYVHLDVRPFGHGHPMWIDLAGPGEPSQYVDHWPGVVESGALSGAGEE